VDVNLDERLGHEKPDSDEGGAKGSYREAVELRSPGSRRSRAPWGTGPNKLVTPKALHTRPQQKIVTSCNAFGVTVLIESNPGCAANAATLGFGVERLRRNRVNRLVTTARRILVFCRFTLSSAYYAFANAN
jgi:hypothetical protein